MKHALTAQSLADLLNRQHREVDAQLANVLNAVKSGDWRECDRCWYPMSQTLLGHMTFEEHWLFPTYEQSSATAAGDVRTLRAEHKEIQRLLDLLACDIQMHHALPTRLEEFIVSLRQHARREDALFHPWLATAVLHEDILHRAREWVSRIVGKAA